MRASVLIIVALGLLGQIGCAHFWKKPKVNYQTVRANPNRDSELAVKKTEEAAKHFERGRYDKAEAALQEALVADVTYGPAHSNLGTLYFQECKYYLAAWEYEYAIRVMPERAEPYNNLGLVYAAAEKPERAIEMFETARRLEPNNPEYLGNLVRTLVRRDGPSAEARSMLEELIMYETRPEWSCWAREQLAVAKYPEVPIVAPTVLEVLPTAPTSTSEDIPLPSATLPPPPGFPKPVAGEGAEIPPPSAVRTDEDEAI